MVPDGENTLPKSTAPIIPDTESPVIREHFRPGWPESAPGFSYEHTNMIIRYDYIINGTDPKRTRQSVRHPLPDGSLWALSPIHHRPSTFTPPEGGSSLRIFPAFQDFPCPSGFVCPSGSIKDKTPQAGFEVF